MWNISHQLLALALVSGLTAAAALAQSDRPWVDPPNGLSEPAQVPQTAPPRPSAGPETETTAAPTAPAPSERAKRPQPQAQGQVTPPSALAPAPITRAPEPAPPNELALCAAPAERVQDQNSFRLDLCATVRQGRQNDCHRQRSGASPREKASQRQGHPPGTHRYLTPGSLMPEEATTAQLGGQKTVREGDAATRLPVLPGAADLCG